MTDPDPLTWARSWLPANDEAARPLMTLSTVDREGGPAARTVLLSEVTDTGFAFHTDGRSEKVTELKADPRVCLTLVFLDLFRQIVVGGIAKPQDDLRSRAAFGRRSAYLRQLAWLNEPELAQLSTEERRQRWADAAAALPEGPLQPPPTWVGYEVLPTRYKFWEGGTDVPGRRTQFRQTDGGWDISYLPG